MFGRRDETDYMRHGSAREWWPNRARRREREQAAERMSDLRWRWRSVCSTTSLAPIVYTPSGVTRPVPTIEQIDLGPPVTLTVRMRLGQTIADFVDAAPKIAPAMEVAGTQVTPIAQQ